MKKQHAVVSKSWMWMLALMLSALVLGIAVAAPAIVGDWSGAISTGSNSLRAVIHVALDKDGKLTATMDSPDQGVTGIPISSISYKEPALHFEIEKFGASYDGTMNKDNSGIAGTWKQGGASLPLNLKRMAARSSVVQPSAGPASAIDSAPIPFELYENLIYVPVRANASRPLRFVIDTGATYSVLNDKMAREIGLRPGPEEQISLGSGEGGTKLWHAKEVSFSIGSNQFVSGDVLVLSLQDIERISGRAIDGVLGADLFRGYVLKIDYAARQLRFFDPQTFVYHGPGETVPLTLSGVPFVTASVTVPGNKTVKGLFVVDTGSHSALGLNSPFVAKNNLLDGIKAVSSIDISLGGVWPKMVGRLESLQIGSFSLEQPLTDFSKATSGQRSNSMFSGVIGGAIWRRFTVIFNYSHQEMILEPNAEMKKPFEDDASGLILSAEGTDFNTITVQHVIENSPADDSGLREGDVITGIAEKTGPRTPSLDELREMFRLPGHEYTILVERGKQTLRLRMKTGQIV